VIDFSRSTHPILNQAGRDWAMGKRKSHFPPKENDVNTRTLSGFVSARINEHTDPDETEALRELWNMAHDQIDVTPPYYPVARHYVPGEVKNERALRELARQWRDHPDYRQEWA
jgi:hypothetical protein